MFILQVSSCSEPSNSLIRNEGVSPSGSSEENIDQVHWTATGPIASSSAVVCVHPRGPPKSSRTRPEKPRAIESPSSER